MKRLLADRLRTATPLYELELGNSAIGHEIMLAAGIAGAERHRFDALVPLHDVRKYYEHPDGVDYNMDLPCEILDL